MSTDENRVNPLLDAVDLLTKPRTIVQWQDAHEHEWAACTGKHEESYGTEKCGVKDCLVVTCTLCDAVKTGDEVTAPAGMQRRVHPPLITMLIEGTGAGKSARNSDRKIPIDADALELWMQIRELTLLWCKQLDASFIHDDLLLSIRHWYMAHANAYRAGKFSNVIDHDVTRLVEGWVRMIENKFDPPEKREWTDACPAYRVNRDIDGNEIGHHRCGARRVVVDGEERFAIQLNVTTMTAECASCKTRWVGERSIVMLRYESNLYKLERDDAEVARMAELERLAAGSDTLAQANG